MTSFLLRLKTKDGPKIISDLTPDSSLLDLKQKVCDQTGISESDLHILFGYPPKVLDLTANSSSIDSMGLRSGDTLIIEQKTVPVAEQVVNETQERLQHITAEQCNSHGILMRKTVPSDNSCLFTSIGFVLGGKVDPSCALDMRQLIAAEVSTNVDEYSEAILGRPNKDYCKWIQKSDSWGGAIELSILSRHYGIEIAVVDTINGIINRFGEDKDYGQRVFLIFDGIHYDPLYLEQMTVDGRIQTIFPSDDDRVFAEAQELAQEAKTSRQFTDVNNFTLKCLVCQMLLTGQVQAQKHAKESGHKDFGEVAS